MGQTAARAETVDSGNANSGGVIGVGSTPTTEIFYLEAQLAASLLHILHKATIAGRMLKGHTAHGAAHTGAGASNGGMGNHFLHRGLNGFQAIAIASTHIHL